MNKLLIGGAGAAAGLGLAGAATAAYVARAVQGRATGDLNALIDSNSDVTKDVVVFLGASIVKGRASVDFVDIVRHEYPDLEIVNAGENGNTARDVLERLEFVIQVRPKVVIILVGTNDVQAALNPNGSLASSQRKAHGSDPTPESYAQTLTKIVTQLQVTTGCKIALCSLPPLGQDLPDAANEMVRTFNNEIERVAQDNGATYLDVYAVMAQVLANAGVASTKPFTGKWQPSMRSLTQHFVIGKSYDQIADAEGLLLSPDYVHLNTRGAQIVAELAEGYLSSLSQQDESPSQPATASEPVESVASSEPVETERLPAATSAATQPDADFVETPSQRESAESTAGAATSPYGN